MPGLCSRAGCPAATLPSINQPDMQVNTRGPQGSHLTYSVMAFFSEKILRQKSASWCGSNVVGIRM